MYLMENYGDKPLHFQKGFGSWLFTEEGEGYLDFVSGIAVNSLGHCHPKIVDMITSQAKQLLHTSNLYGNAPQDQLAKRLVESSGMSAAFFCNSGTEAVEAALKIARKHGAKTSKSKNRVLFMSGSFHGRTLGALSVTSNDAYKKSFLPADMESVGVSFNKVEDLEKTMDGSVCAVIVEPVQGEGGIRLADQVFLKSLRSMCKDHDALLIFDEVQCGVGRVGSLYAFEQFGIQPDVICMAKGLGGGVPIGAVLCNDKANVLEPGDHGSTFGGNPLVCSVAHVVLDVLTQEGVLQSVGPKGAYLKKKLQDLQTRSKFIKGVSGLGLMIGLQLSVDVKEVVEMARDKNLLVVSAGENTLRLLPPLTVSYTEMDQAIEKIEGVFEELSLNETIN